MDLPVALPADLRERSRQVRPADLRADGEFVLYWMRTAVRAHENPALDVALTAAAELDRPVLVYHALSERYPYASDRHHAFIVQGARDVARELAGRGVGYVLHVERRGHRGPHLKGLAARAAVVVTEEMPVAPLDRWTRSAAKAAGAPVVAVDTACLVPMALTREAPTRAFEFRRATAAQRRERLGRRYREVAVAHPPCRPELPFAPVDPEAIDLAELLAECEIDHGIPPVAGTVGGSRAGYARWEAFRERGLARYARDRNDPGRDGVSRLSPYLHYGMVSPFRIAREAAEQAGDGARKYLDELLVWRELAYHFCYHRSDHAAVTALPEWAAAALERHEGDERRELPSWETLARGRTGDELWDAAQTSLLRHGELHNNVRMTWGKALLGWTPTAARALELLEDLNHRYALDGRDPSSYGGILWCLGQFDRPFRPERPIFGPVRARSTEGHRGRLDLAAYRSQTGAPAVPRPPATLVVGAGISGLACARTLADAGVSVAVLDKGRRPGGRASTRESDRGGFDHGAQYFTARDSRFLPAVRSWRHDGIVAPWAGRVGTLERGSVGEPRGSAERWVAVPGMGALAEHLASGLEVASGVRVERVERHADGWSVVDADGTEHRAERLVLALPAPQARTLLGEGDPLSARLAEVEMAPCLATMVRFARRWDLPLDGVFVSGSPLSWMARDASKPGRAAGERWVLHAGSDFSRRWLESSPRDFVQPMLAAAAAASSAARRPLPPIVEAVGHRWRYALAETPLGRECLADGDRGLVVCGDWCPGARVEGAFLSGVAAAGAILRRASLRLSGAAGGGSARETSADPPAAHSAQLPLDLAPPAAARLGGSAP